MTVQSVTPILQAAAFTLGCATIHTLRNYPEQVARVLIAIIVVLLIVLAVQITPANVLVDESNAEIGESIASAIK